MTMHLTQESTGVQRLQGPGLLWLLGVVSQEHLHQKVESKQYPSVSQSSVPREKKNGTHFSLTFGSPGR